MDLDVNSLCPCRHASNPQLSSDGPQSLARKAYREFMKCNSTAQVLKLHQHVGDFPLRRGPEQCLRNDDTLTVECGRRRTIEPVAKRERLAYSSAERCIVHTRQKAVDRKTVGRRFHLAAHFSAIRFRLVKVAGSPTFARFASMRPRTNDSAPENVILWTTSVVASDG